MFFSLNVLNVFINLQVQDLCHHAVGITEDHHNTVYLVGLLPLVERGAHLQRVLSLVFMHKYMPQANCFDDLLEPKVRFSWLQYYSFFLI